MRLVRLTQLKIGETTSVCCGKTVMLVRKMDTGFMTAEEGCDLRSSATFQVQACVVASFTSGHLCTLDAEVETSHHTP